jgi:hypothetical protein
VEPLQPGSSGGRGLICDIVLLLRWIRRGCRLFIAIASFEREGQLLWEALHEPEQVVV